MIVNHEKKWIYISPPKTSSTSLCYLLTDGKYQNNLWGKTLEANFEGQNFFSQHYPSKYDQLDKQYDNYMKFVSVRNPFARIVSLWRHWRFGNNLNEGNQKKDDVGLDKFLKMVQWSKSDGSIDLGDNGFFTLCCSDWYKLGYNVIFVESLKSGLYDLNLHKKDFEIPCLNDFKRLPNKTPWNEVHTSKTIELTIEWAKSDFELFGYETFF